jgi:cell division protein FtsN
LLYVSVIITADFAMCRYCYAMTRNNDDHSDDEDGPLPRYGANHIDDDQRREPSFSSFDVDDDDEDAYEEPDRDTDYTSGFSADGVDEEEEFEEELPDDEELYLAPEADDPPGYQPSSVWREPGESGDDESDEWLEEEDFDEEEESDQKWPLGLIAVAGVALVLLAAGGYGVIQQRAATEEELRQLRATLATSENHAETSANRDALQELKLSNEKLAATAEALTLENRRLADTVAGLQAQLGVQQAVLTKTVPAAKVQEPESTPAAAPQPVAPKSAAPNSATPKPTAPKPAAAVSLPPPPASAPPSSAAAPSSGPWFVNFGSYGSREVAESWAGKLLPGAGKVIVAPNTRDGQTLYRLRVIGLSSKSSAEEVARKLEREQRVSQLWVGRE